MPAVLATTRVEQPEAASGIHLTWDCASFSTLGTLLTTTRRHTRVLTTVLTYAHTSYMQVATTTKTNTELCE